MSLSSKMATSLGVSIGILGRLLLQPGGGFGASGAIYDGVHLGDDVNEDSRLAWQVAGAILGATYCFFDSTTKAERPPQNRHAFFEVLAHARAHPYQAFGIEFLSENQEESESLVLNH